MSHSLTVRLTSVFLIVFGKQQFLQFTHLELHFIVGFSLFIECVDSKKKKRNISTLTFEITIFIIIAKRRKLKDYHIMAAPIVATLF